MNSVEQQQDVDVDIVALWAALKRAKFKILLFMIIVFFAVLFIAASIAPKYRAETRILIEQQEAQFTRVDNAGAGNRGVLDGESIESQVEVLRSADLLSEVANELNLADLSEFNDAKPSAGDQLLITMGVKQRQPAMEANDRVLRAMRERLKIYRVERSRVIVISFESKDAQLSAKIPDTIADIYLQKQREQKINSDSRATDWLGPEIESLRSRVKAAEARVAKFRSESDLLPSTNGQSTLGTQQLSELSSELSRLRANRASAQATIDAAQSSIGSGGSLSAIPSVLSSATVQRLRDRETQLRAQLADLSTTLLNGHPRVISARAQLRDVQNQVRVEIQKELASLKTQVQTAKLREQQVRDELNQLKIQTASAGEQEVELRALEREATSERNLLESYLIRFNAASSRQQGSYVPADARIFSRAIVPTEPFAPKIIPMVGGAVVGAFMLSVIFVLLSELFSGRAMRRTPHASQPMHPNYAAEPGTPMMDQAAEQAVAQASVEAPPAYQNPQPQPMVRQQAAPMAEPKRGASVIAAKAALGSIINRGAELRAHAVTPEPAPQPAMAPIPQKLDIRPSTVQVVANSVVSAGKSRAIVVSSNGPADTASSVLFARHLSDQNIMTLVIDLTLDAAVTVPMLDNASTIGLTNVLCKEVELAESIMIDRYSSCHIIARGSANPAMALRNIDQLPRMLKTLERAYDLVVLAVGEAEAEGVVGFVNKKTDVIVSTFEPDEDALEQKLIALAEHGITRVHVMQPILQQAAPAAA